MIRYTHHELDFDAGLNCASNLIDVDGDEDDDGFVEMGSSFGGFTEGNMLESLVIVSDGFSICHFFGFKDKDSWF